MLSQRILFTFTTHILLFTYIILYFLLLNFNAPSLVLLTLRVPKQEKLQKRRKKT